MIVLDADSYMRADAVLQLARIAEAYPKIGILQSLVVGAPSRSAFARLFQFGMRAGMRSYTAGAAWWTADCGPFWGTMRWCASARFSTIAIFRPCAAARSCRMTSSKPR
ncbi:MAG: hypothetical protein H6871_02640 [Methylobacteriaceae bacterium]|nr:hypothetical protein [Methylobacteriaceae bacterium]